MSIFSKQKFSNVSIETIANYSIILYAFLIPLARISVVFFSIFLFILWIIKLYQTKDFSIFKETFIIALLLFFTFTAISLFWSMEVKEGLNDLRRYTYLLALPAFLSLISRDIIKKVFIAFILGLLISELIAYGVFFEFWTFKSATPDNPSPFMHHIVYSIFLSFGALIIVNNFLHNKRNMYLSMKIAHFAIFFLTAGVLFLIHGRTGQIAFIIGLLVVIYFKYQFSKKTLLIFTSLSAVVLITAYNFSDSFFERSQKTVKNFVNSIEKEDYCTSIGLRVGSWLIANESIKQEPILGYGLGSEMRTFYNQVHNNPKFHCYQEEKFAHMHSQYLQILMQSGIVGFSFFMLFMLSLWTIKISNKQISDIRYILLILFLIGFFTEPLISNRNFSAGLFVLFCSIALVYREVKTGDN